MRWQSSFPRRTAERSRTVRSSSTRLARQRRYRDPSGAILAIHLAANDEIAWVQPSFGRALRIRWRPQSVVPDDDAAFCDLVFAERLAADDAMIYPFAMLHRVDRQLSAS